MRLTKWINGHLSIGNATQDDIIKRLLAYEDTGYSPLEIKSLESEWNAARAVVDSYRNAEEQGLLMRLPCKVGDTFYYIAGTLRGNEYVTSDTVAAIEISDAKPWIIDSCGCHHIEFWSTREEAETKLKGDREKCMKV